MISCNYVKLNNRAEVMMRKKISGLNQSAGETMRRNMQAESRTISIFYLWILMMYLTGCSTTIVDIPIALHKAGSVIEADFEIPQEDRISLRLCFFYNGPDEGKRLSQFLGHELHLDKMVSVPLKIKIIKYTNIQESVFLDKTYVTTGQSDGNPKWLSRLVDELSIKAGKYRIQVETIKDFPQLTNIKVNLNIRYIRPPYYIGHPIL